MHTLENQETKMGGLEESRAIVNFLSTFYVEDMALRAVYILFHFLLTQTNEGSKYYKHPLFSKEEYEYSREVICSKIHNP